MTVRSKPILDISTTSLTIERGHSDRAAYLTLSSLADADVEVIPTSTDERVCRVEANGTFTPAAAAAFEANLALEKGETKLEIAKDSVNDVVGRVSSSAPRPAAPQQCMHICVLLLCDC